MGRPHKLAVETLFRSGEGEGGSGSGVKFALVPGMGDHWFMFDGKWFRVIKLLLYSSQFRMNSFIFELQ
jgi:hypothetical protein